MPNIENNETDDVQNEADGFVLARELGLSIVSSVSATPMLLTPSEGNAFLMNFRLKWSDHISNHNAVDADIPLDILLITLTSTYGLISKALESANNNNIKLATSYVEIADLKQSIEDAENALKKISISANKILVESDFEHESS
jgi:hypothetical protein